MQYSKLMLDRLPEVVVPFGRRQTIETSMFQPVECTSVYPLALDHFHHATGKPDAAQYPVVAVTQTSVVPPFAPPFKYGWIEWVDKGAGTGVAVVTFDENEGWANDSPEYKDFVRGARWTQILVPYFAITGENRAPRHVDFVTLQTISPEGKPMNALYIHRGEVLHRGEAVDSRPIWPGSDVKLSDVSAPGVCTIALFFQALLSCRNVDRLPVDPPPALSKKRVKHGHLPLVRYHTLRVKIPGTQRYFDPHAAHRPGAEPSVGLHVVRGHFKTYTAERPLLGRATGTFYWPPNLRGSLKRGSVGKHYVESPETGG